MGDSCDVADKLDLARAINQCQEMPPVRGVIQGAMVLQVGDLWLNINTEFDINEYIRTRFLKKMSFVDFNTALRPKLEGSWNLHQQFSGSQLDFFIMLSSMTGVAGNSSQANYAAGGSFQDALARHRAAQGLPAVSIDLGMVRSLGSVAETKGVADRMMKSGYQFVQEEEVLRLIEAAITKPIRQQHSSQILIGIASGAGADWGTAPWRHDLRFGGLLQVEEFLQAEDSTKDKQKDALGFKSQLVNAKPWDEAVNQICAAIVTKISEMFSMPESEIDKTATLARYGIDSLVAVELRNWLSHTFQGQSSIFDVMQSSSLIVLAAKTALKSKLVDPAFHPSTVHWH